ncbi:RIKEN cDNA 2310016E02, putative [Brugia malayi]|uniref:Uncharacterized protein n=1 Tax=Brugia malayi TaxID=6279 RepID=A0A4E9FI69_BRUMA|nr:RIKEN cDNA 2310016E02, putative [Brugia malayi]VIO95168.1 RIKEN cDNA 2310016E02, putative [Brugia malayi]
MIRKAILLLKHLRNQDALSFRQDQKQIWWSAVSSISDRYSGNVLTVQDNI